MRCLAGLGFLLWLAAAAADQVTLRDGTTRADVTVVGWTATELLIRRGAEVVALARELVRDVTPSDPWDAGRLTAASDRARGAARARQAIAILRTALAHAPSGPARHALIVALAIRLQADDQLAAAWHVLRELPESAQRGALNARVRERVAELRRREAAAPNDATRRHAVLGALLPLVDIPASAVPPRELTRGLAQVAEQFVAGRARDERGADCDRCKGQILLLCGACGGTGRAPKTRFGRSDCRKCSKGRVWCGGCSRSGLKRASLPRPLQRRLSAFVGDLHRQLTLTADYGRIPALVLRHQFLVPAWVSPEGKDRHKVMQQTLEHGHRLDAWSPLLPLRKGDWPTTAFTHARAEPASAAALAATPAGSKARWVLTVMTVGGVETLARPLARTRLQCDLPLDIVALTPAALARVRAELEAHLAGAGRIGAQLEAWIAAVPVRAVETRLAELVAGTRVAVYGRLQAAPADRLDRRPTLEIWDVRPVVSAGSK